MVLHEAKYDQAGITGEYLPLALTPLCNNEMFPDAYSTAADIDGAFPMPLFAFGDSDEDDEDDMEEDNFDDMEEEDFDEDDDEEEDDDEDDDDDEEDEEDFDDDDYDYDDDEEFEYNEE